MKKNALLLFCVLLFSGKVFCAVITVTYHNPNSWTPQAKAAFEVAVGIWEQTVYSPVEIKIQAFFVNFSVEYDGTESEDLFGFNGIGEHFMNFGSFHPAYFPQHQYAAALAEKLHGSAMPSGSWNWNYPYHFTVYMNNNKPWDFSESYNPTQGHYDFISLALREIGHGLGFHSSARFQEYLGQATYELIPYIMDRYIVNNYGNYLTSVSTGTAHAFLTSGELYFKGPQAVPANGYSWPQLYAPDPWKPRLSIDHWNQGEYSTTDPDALMQPSPEYSAQSFHRAIGDVTEALMADIGWDLDPPNGTGKPPGDPVLVAHPNPSSSGKFNVGLPEPAPYEVCDLSGAIVQRGTTAGPLDLSALPGGMYLARFATGSETHIVKLIKSTP